MFMNLQLRMAREIDALAASMELTRRSRWGRDQHHSSTWRTQSKKTLCIAVLIIDYWFTCDIFWVWWHMFWELCHIVTCQESGVSESGAVRNTPSTYLLINATVCLGSALSQHVFNTPYRDNTTMVRSPLAMSPPSKFTSSVEDTPTPTRMATNGSNTTVTFPVPQSEWKFCTPKRPRTKSLRTPEYDDGKIVFKDFHTKSKTKNARSPAASSATSYSLSPLSLKFSSTYVAAVHKRRAAIVRELMGSDNSSSCVNTDKGKAMNSWEVQ